MSLRSDAAPGLDAAVPTDAAVALPEVCEGPAWAAGPAGEPRPVVVTSTRLVMDCCDGAVVHFHAAPFLGFDPVVMIRAWGAWPSPGTWDLAAMAPDQALEVRIFPDGDDTQDEQRLKGWLRLEVEGEDPYASPLRLSLCVTSIQGGPEVEGVRLWVPSLPVMPWDWWERFGLHLLADPDLTPAQAAALPLEDLALDEAPRVSLGNLRFYERSTHTLRLEPWYGDQLTALLPEVGVSGLPFVVVVDQAPIYLGAFFTAFSSQTFGQPVIVLGDLEDGEVRIERAYPGPGAAEGTDPRGDPRLIELLEAAGKLAP